ncbi:AMP-binding protein [Modestobacter roseus]|uniref:Fatty-acyl-CoA synthase n=1 Tax=Modestobacter roseus TaxID=1181884 RepID=A0A562IUL6_9ACTN|nr:AMP-binding protein [Modestobacter roseus]TWH74699.1 fatty-acyl-CoA synthase [Modestobacter roseus]
MTAPAADAVQRDDVATRLEAVADAISALDPGRAALVAGERAVTWAEFDQQAARLAGHLAAAGVGPGARVGIGLHNSPEYLIGVFAACKLRAVPVNVNYRYRATELAQVLGYVAAEAVLVDDGLAGTLAEVAGRLPSLRTVVRCGPGSQDDGAVPWEQALDAAPLPRCERSPDDQVWLLTGGTTGAPKAVVWDSAGVCAVVASAYRRAGVPVPRDRAGAVAAAVAAVRGGTAPVVLPGSPLMHGTGFFAAFGNLLRGGCVVTLTDPSLDPAELWRAVERHGVEELAIVGDAFAVPLLAELDRAAAAGRPYDLGSLRRVISSGVRWSPDVKRRLLAAGRMTLQDTIAATEGGPFGVSLVGPDPESVTTRFALPENARVLTPDGRDVVPGSGEVGELASSGALPLGYLDAPELTASVFRMVDGVRHVVPGDSATVEADGTLSLLGRGSGVINTGGEKVFAEEVEQALLDHPLVRDAVVLGLPDDRWGSRVTALVVADPPGEATARSLADHVGSVLAGYKRPRSVLFVETVRRSASGKVDRSWAQQAARQLTGPAPTSSTEIEEARR